MRSTLRSLWRLAFPGAVALSLGAVSSLACDTTESPQVQGADLRADELEARCDYLVRCGFMPSRDTCMASEAPDPGLVQALGATSFERTEYDPEAAARWLDTLRTVGCEATLDNARLLAEARAAVFEGLVDPGGACFADEECAGSAVCDRSACPGNQLCCTGECIELRTLTIGESCPLPQQGQRLTATCESLAYCQAPPDDGSGNPPTAGTCLARVDNGLPCESVDGCLDGQRCDLGGSNNCYRLSASGEMCNPELGRGSCIEHNQVCSTNSSTCVRAPAAGEACVQGQCAGHTVCQDGTCIARPGRGESCEGTPPCLGDLQCRDGVCSEITTSVVCVDGEPPPPPM